MGWDGVQIPPKHVCELERPGPCPNRLTTAVLIPQAYVHGGQSLYLENGCFSDLWMLEAGPVFNSNHTVAWTLLWKGSRTCAPPPYVMPARPLRL